MTSQELPQRARVVIVSGGVIGCSVAYHLGHLGWTDVVLLETTVNRCDGRKATKSISRSGRWE